jgi:hypothetical protein
MKIAARSLSLAQLAAFLLLASLDVRAAPGPTVLPVIDGFVEIQEHLIGEHPRVLTAWTDITADRDSPSCPC